MRIRGPGALLQAATLVLLISAYLADNHRSIIRKQREETGTQPKAARECVEDSEFIANALQSPDPNVRRIGGWLKAAAKALVGASEGSEQKAAGEAAQHLAEAERVISQLMLEGKGLTRSW